MFKNLQDEQKFLEYGYVKFSLLEKESIIKLKNLYESTKNEVGIVDKTFYTSIWSDNKSYKEKVDKEIKEILEPILLKYLEGFQSVFANFMVKLAGENSQLPPHQDWSFVN